MKAYTQEKYIVGHENQRDIVSIYAVILFWMTAFLCQKIPERRELLSKEELIKRLRDVEMSRSMFEQIMNATSVKELLDIVSKPEELLDYFKAAEEMGKIEEQGLEFCQKVAQRLRETRTEKRNQRVLFM